MAESFKRASAPLAPSMGMPRISPDRILVKEVNWLGDTVMSLPALRALRGAFPSARVALLIKEELASFFDGAAWLDEVIPYAVAPGIRGLTDRFGIVAAIRKRRFDLAVLFPNSFESALWVWLAGVPHRAGFGVDARGSLLTARTLPSRDSMQSHQVNYLMQMLRDTLGVEGSVDDYRPEISRIHLEKMRVWLDERRRNISARLIVLAPAASYGPAKEWPAENFPALAALLARRYGAEVLLIGAPGEREKCERVRIASGTAAIVAAGAASVGESLALLSLCSGFAGNDSGSMHLAGAVGIPTVGIYGSTCPERTGPLGPRTRTLYHRIECSPCLKRTCRFGHYNCLRMITPEEVARALEELGAFD